MAITLNVIAIMTGLLAVAISLLSLHNSVQGNRASLFKHRFDVYSDAEKFIGAWQREGRPSMDELPTLVGAWSRSRFLFDESVSQYLRMLWTESLEAVEAHKIMSGEVVGDRDAALKKFHAIMREQADAEKLRTQFLSHMMVQPSLIDNLRPLLSRPQK